MLSGQVNKLAGFAPDAGRSAYTGGPRKAAVEQMNG